MAALARVADSNESLRERLLAVKPLATDDELAPTFASCRAGDESPQDLHVVARRSDAAREDPGLAKLLLLPFSRPVPE